MNCRGQGKTGEELRIVGLSETAHFEPLDRLVLFHRLDEVSIGHALHRDQGPLLDSTYGFRWLSAMMNGYAMYARDFLSRVTALR
jgi:hypothetical protein